jgi:hypothetical protein
LWGCSSGCAFAYLVREAEGFRDGEERLDCKEGGSFFEGFGEDTSAAAGEDVVDATKDFGCVRKRLEISFGRKGNRGTYCLLGFRRSTLREVSGDSSLESPA